VRNMNHHKPFGVISKDESLRSLGGSRKSQWSVGSRSWWRNQKPKVKNLKPIDSYW